jgi:hypothetical protein
MKKRMWKYFSCNNSYRYIDVLQEMVDRLITLDTHQLR